MLCVDFLGVMINKTVLLLYILSWCVDWILLHQICLKVIYILHCCFIVMDINIYSSIIINYVQLYTYTSYSIHTCSTGFISIHTFSDLTITIIIHYIMLTIHQSNTFNTFIIQYNAFKTSISIKYSTQHHVNCTK